MLFKLYFKMIMDMLGIVVNVYLKFRMLNIYM